jgi:hypothetical protein
LINILPTSVDPVKLSLRSRGSSMIGSEISPDELAVSTLRTPAGRPHSSSSCARSSIDSGVFWAGLITIVQPAAIAGPILRVPIAVGKFHGVMKKQGPTGWRITSTLLAPLPAAL